MHSDMLSGWQEIATFCRVSLVTARRMGKRGLPHYKNPRVVAFRSEVLAWIKRQQVSAHDRI